MSEFEPFVVHVPASFQTRYPNVYSPVAWAKTSPPNLPDLFGIWFPWGALPLIDAEITRDIRVKEFENGELGAYVRRSRKPIVTVRSNSREDIQWLDEETSGLFLTNRSRDLIFQKPPLDLLVQPIRYDVRGRRGISLQLIAVRLLDISPKYSSLPDNPFVLGLGK